MCHDGLCNDISCIKHVSEELHTCLFWDVFQSERNEKKGNKKIIVPILIKSICSMC